MEQMKQDKAFKIGGKIRAGYSRAEIKKTYPAGGYRILGETGNGRSKKVQERIDAQLNEGQSDLLVHRSGSYPSWRYKTVGYLLGEKEDEYIVVKRSILYYYLLLLLVLAGIAAAFLFFYKGKETDKGPQVEGEAYQSNIKRPDDWDETKILIPAYPDLQMIEGTNVLYVALMNPERNPCFFQFSIIEDETEDVLYESKLIEPGNAVTSQELTKDLKAGTYDVTIKIRAYDLNDYEQELNGGEVKTKLIVLEPEKE